MLIRPLHIALVALSSLSTCATMWAQAADVGLHTPADASPSATHLGYTIEVDASLGSGEFSPYHLSSNRHGLPSALSRSGYTRIGIQAQRRRGSFSLGAGADVVASAHNPAHQSAVFIQQLYVQGSWRWVTLMAGSQEQQGLLRDFCLSSGSLIWSGNARPIPQVRVASHGFISILPHDNLQVYADMSYGRFTDSDFLAERYLDYSEGQTGQNASYVATGAWFHYKQGYLRTNPHRPLVFTLGIEHAVQFGGKATNIDFDGQTISYKVRPQDLLKVMIPLQGDDRDPQGDQAFIYGNHIGNIHALLEYQRTSDQGYNHRWGLYVENMFEDGSGAVKHNGWDGLWGMEYHNSAPHALLAGVVMEYLQTTDQSGPMHWDPVDYTSSFGSEFGQGEARGADDYYNNYFYTGYSHYGQACGSPMIKSPIYNRDGYLRFTDNRVTAWHVGMNGHLPIIDYRLLASYRRSWGTHFAPSCDIRHSFDLMLELAYHYRDWQFTTSFALDRGTIYGDNTALGLNIRYNGKIL